MATNIHAAEADYPLIKQQIWDKFQNRLQEWRAYQQSPRTASSLNPTDMAPDVMVISKNNTLIFEPRTPAAAIWLRNRYRLTAETPHDEAGILVHPQQQGQLTAELQAAGFTVAE